MGLPGDTTYTSLGGRGPLSSRSSQSRSGCQVSGSLGPSTTLAPPPVICAPAKSSLLDHLIAA